jgi:microcystin-dependent protein
MTIKKAIAAGAALTTLFVSSQALPQPEPFIGTVMWFGGNFCPRGWAATNGQILSIAQNTALFSLLGTTYGGNGQTTFALPDLRGRIAVHDGQGPGLTPRTLGEVYGSETHTLTVTEMPSHTHSASPQFVMRAAGGNGATPAPAGNTLADTRTARIYSTAPSNVDLGTTSLSAQTTVGPTGGNQPFENLQPYLAVTACIALEGIYPSRN